MTHARGWGKRCSRDKGPGSLLLQQTAACPFKKCPTTQVLSRSRARFLGAYPMGRAEEGRPQLHMHFGLIPWNSSHPAGRASVPPPGSVIWEPQSRVGVHPAGGSSPGPTASTRGNTVQQGLSPPPTPAPTKSSPCLRLAAVGTLSSGGQDMGFIHVPHGVHRTPPTVKSTWL